MSEQDTVVGESNVPTADSDQQEPGWKQTVTSYLLPGWAQYILLTILLFVTTVYGVVQNPSRLVLLSGGGATFIAGYMASVSTLYGDDPLRNTTVRQLLAVYFFLSTVFSVLVLL